MLGAELFDLKGLGFDLGATAFDEDELSKLLTPKGLKGPRPAKRSLSCRGQDNLADRSTWNRSGVEWKEACGPAVPLLFTAQNQLRAMR